MYGVLLLSTTRYTPSTTGMDRIIVPTAILYQQYFCDTQRIKILFSYTCYNYFNEPSLACALQKHILLRTRRELADTTGRLVLHKYYFELARRFQKRRGAMTLKCPVMFFSTFMCNTHNLILSLHYEAHTRVPDAKTKLTAAQTRFPDEQLNTQKIRRLWYNQSSTHHDSVEAAMWQV